MAGNHGRDQPTLRRPCCLRRRGRLPSFPASAGTSLPSTERERGMVRRATQPVRKGRPRLRSRRVSRRTIAAFSLRRRAALSAGPDAAFAAGRPSAGSRQGPFSSPGRSPAVARGRACETRARAPHRSGTGIARPCPGRLRRVSPRHPFLRPAFRNASRQAPSSGRGDRKIIIDAGFCQVPRCGGARAGQRVSGNVRRRSTVARSSGQ